MIEKNSNKGKYVIELVSIREYARRRDCNESAVRRALTDGRIKLTNDGPRKLIDVEQANFDWEANTKIQCKPNSTNDDKPDERANISERFNNARALKEEATAKLKQLELDEKRGALVKIDDVCIEVEREYSIVRQNIFSLPSKLAKPLSFLTEPKEIQAKILDEINKVMDNLQHDKRSKKTLDKFNKENIKASKQIKYSRMGK